MVDLVAKEDFKHLYIADKDNSRIVVLDLAGNFVKQFKYTNSVEWGDLKSIAVSSDEKMLYVLNGTKVYEISL
jgi:DNA-binding beta-propeller fold protein YncE